MVLMMIQKKNELISIQHLILTVVVCSMTSHAMVSRTFRVQVNSTGGSVCAVDTPSTMIPLAASTMAGQCGTMCNVDPSCEFFQFKEDSAHCELFKYSPSNFITVDHCTAYRTLPGYIGILVQQHYYGSTFFQRTWNEFKAGFGDVNSNYWIGNEQLHMLTSSGQYRLRVDLQARANCQWYWAEYSTFIVDSETNFYRLTIGGYSGTAGDAMTMNSAYHNLNGMMFTTLDADHDQCSSCNCAITPLLGKTCGGGFWNRNCITAWINTPSTCGFTWEGLPTADTKLMYTRLRLISPL